MKEFEPGRDESIPEKEAAEAEGRNPHHDGGRVWGLTRRRFRKVVWFGAPALCLILAVACFFFIKSKMNIPLSAKTSSTRLEPVTCIMRPIPVPDYREMLDFLLVYGTDGQKMITAIRMEIGFQNPTRYQNFKDQNVAFRDTVYSFLLQQNPSGNTVKSWHSVLEKDLCDFLRVKLPQSYADTIHLTQVENL